MNNTITAADTSHDYRRCLAIMNRAEAEGRDLSPDECREMDSMMASISTSLAAETRSAGRLSEPNDVAICAPGDTRYMDAEPMPRGITGKKCYADLFGAAPRDARGFRSFGDFIAHVGSNMTHPSLQRVSADWGEDTGSTG